MHQIDGLGLMVKIAFEERLRFRETAKTAPEWRESYCVGFRISRSPMVG